VVTRLKELREARFLSQAALSKLAGVAEATIVRTEMGQGVPNFATIHKLATALGVEPGELVPDAAAYSEARRRAPRKAAAKPNEEGEGGTA